MADNCIIGPVRIADPYLVSEVEPLDKEGKEFFKVRCTKPQARQLLGLVSYFTEKTVNGRKVYNLNGGYGVIPIDASVNVSDGLIRPRGLYLVEDVLTDLRPASPNSVVGLTVRKLSDDFTGLLDMDYTTGYNDGTALASTYPPGEKSKKFTDEFSSFDSAVWNTPIRSGLSSSSITASGGDLTLTGKASSDGVWGYILTSCKTVLNPPFTMEFGLEWVAPAPSGRAHYVALMLTSANPTTTNPYNYEGFRINVTVSATTTTIYVNEFKGGVASVKYKTTLTPSQKAPTFLLSIDSAGKLTLKLDKNGGTNYSTKLTGYKSTVSFGSGYYLSYWFGNNSSTTATVKSERVEVYSYTDLQGRNVVLLPANSTPVTTPSSTRVSEDGNIPVYVNPTGNIEYSTTSANFFKGSVKAWNSNYPDGVSRLVTSVWDVLKVGDFYLTNGLVKLVPIATGVEFYYWNGSAYVLLNTFTTGTITNLKPLYVSPERFTLQVNDTEWTLFRGKLFVYVSHPYTELKYTVGDVYYHDGDYNTPGTGGVDETMLTQFYTIVFTPYNVFSKNVYSGTDTLGDTTGFRPQGSATIESSTLYPDTGTRTLKCQMSAGTGNGFNTFPYPRVRAGSYVSGRMYLAGSGTVVLQLNERDSDDTIINTTTSAPITLTTTPTRYSVNAIFSDAGVKAGMKVLNNSSSNPATVYADSITMCPSYQLKHPGTRAPSEDNKYAMFILKQDPTTIQSDSIPASSLTTIGFFDQTNHYGGTHSYYNLIREAMIKTLQQIGVK